MLTGDTQLQIDTDQAETQCQRFRIPRCVFCNSNKRSDARATLKDKLNKRVILCRPERDISFYPNRIRPPFSRKPKTRFWQSKV